MRKILRALCLVLTVMLLSSAAFAVTIRCSQDGTEPYFNGQKFRAAVAVEGGTEGERYILAFYNGGQMTECCQLSGSGAVSLDLEYQASSFKLFALNNVFTPLCTVVSPTVYSVTTETEFYAAVADENCRNIIVAANMTLTRGFNIEKTVEIADGVLLTVSADGKMITPTKVGTGDYKITPGANVQFTGITEGSTTGGEWG